MPDLELNKRLYRSVYLIRMCEEKIREIYPSDVMKTPVHLSIGEEAIVAGVCQALKPGDQVFGTYRTHALYLAKGGCLDAFFAEMFGKKTGAAKGKAGSMHLSAPEVGFMASSAIVASVIPVALGAAFAAKYRGEDKIVAVFFGDGATEEGVFWETVNSAALMKLPLLFVCENNELSIHTHIADRQAYSIPEAVKPFGLNVFCEETTAPEKIYGLARKAVAAVRSTNTPVFMHFRYHRYFEHVGINEDYGFGYRNRKDYQHWYEADPIKIQREKLAELGLDEPAIRAIEVEVDDLIEKSVAQAEEAGFPVPSALFQDVMI